MNINTYLATVGTPLTSFAWAALRIWVGLNFCLIHGLPKLQNAEQFVAGGAMQQFPFPFVMGWFAILAELLGGALLAVGLWGRAAALTLFGTMVGAAFVVHAGDPWSKKELALTYALICLVYVARGSGAMSLDRTFGVDR